MTNSEKIFADVFYIIIIKILQVKKTCLGMHVRKKKKENRDKQLQIREESV